MIILRKPFDTLWAGKDPFIEVERISGEILRSVATRETLCFKVANQSFYLKLHHGTTYGEVLKNLISGRLPILGAQNEWKAIHRLAELGVDTMKGVAYGEKGINPVKKTSFIITEDLSPTISLEDLCLNWKESPPSTSLKRALITRVAEMVRKMHQGGVNHRDCYLCHFLLHTPFDENHLKISLIDLHRAQIRHKVPKRWRDKDIVGLYFSAINIGLTRTDFLRFLKVYFDLSLRDIFETEKALLATIDKKAKKIHERTVRKGLSSKL